MHISATDRTRPLAYALRIEPTSKGLPAGAIIEDDGRFTLRISPRGKAAPSKLALFRLALPEWITTFRECTALNEPRLYDDYSHWT